MWVSASIFSPVIICTRRLSCLHYHRKNHSQRCAYVCIFIYIYTWFTWSFDSVQCIPGLSKTKAKKVHINIFHQLGRGNGLREFGQVRWKKSLPFHQFFMGRNRGSEKIPSRKLTYPTWGKGWKRKIIFKYAWWGGYVNSLEGIQRQLAISLSWVKHQCWGHTCQRCQGWVRETLSSMKEVQRAHVKIRLRK